MLRLLLRSAVLAAVFASLLGGVAMAQLQSGNLYGTTKDDKGAALPGVTVTLSGQGAPQVQNTDAQGQFRFLGLSPGTYAVKAELQGFSTVDYPNVVIAIGRNTTIEMALSGAVEDVITVTAESPLLDEKSIRTGNTVSQTELAKIPTARDPWAVLQSTPGVLTDRINNGGNESGQQSLYTGPGSGADQAVWSMDGMVITDMSATGSSPGYFDFDSFEELQVTTGGSDASIATGGVVMNMVTKRGTNEWRGSGRYYTTNDSLQSDLSFSKGELGKAGPWNRNTAQTAFAQGNRVDTIQDYGVEIGGPIVKDKLWIWGSYAKPKINLKTINNFSDKTTLEDWNAKLNWQIAASNSLTAFAWDSDKVKLGRNAGPTRPQETTFDQSAFGDKPTAYKVEDSHIFSSAFYLTGMYSKVNGGFQLVPEGGERPFWIDPTGTFHNSNGLVQIERPQEQFRLDGSTFFNTGSVSNELKFGAGHRTADQTTLSHTSGQWYELELTPFGLPGLSQFALGRDELVAVQAKYDNAFLQDTFSVGNLTANVGLRYDKQGGDNVGKQIAANQIRPDLLPAVNYAGGGAGFEWKTISPRLGLTYALGAEHKTLLRASYAQFADQLATGIASWLNPLGAQSYAYFYRDPLLNGQLTPDASDRTVGADGFSANVNPFTGGLVQSNVVAKGLDAPVTHELLLSVEHSLLPEFVVGLNLTYRKYTNALESDLLVFDCADGGSDCATSEANLGLTGRRATRADFVPHDFSAATPGVQNLTGTDPHGRAYDIPVYELRPGLGTRRGLLLSNGNREQEYKGASVVLTKRLSNRWMLRGNFTYSDWKWNVPDGELENPTSLAGYTSPTAFNNFSGDGQQVLQNSGTGSGSKGNVWINSKWSYSVNALYQIAPDRPWGFNVAGNLTGRQGYPVVYIRQVSGGNTLNFNGGTVSVPVTGDLDTYRLDDIHQLDLRVEKDFTFGDFGMTLGVDCFNVFNRSTVLQRRGILNTGTSDHVQEIVSPRLFRVGAKFSFR